MLRKWHFLILRTRSSRDPLTLTNGKISAPCNVCSKKLTSPQRQPDQSVPGVTQKETPVGTGAHSLDFALPASRCPQSFLLQPPVVTEVSLLVWHTGMKDAKLLLPGPKRNSGDPKGLWISLFRCQTRARTQGIPKPPCTVCLPAPSAPAGWPSAKAG